MYEKRKLVLPLKNINILGLKGLTIYSSMKYKLLNERNHFEWMISKDLTTIFHIVLQKISSNFFKFVFHRNDTRTHAYSCLRYRKKEITF